MSGWRCGLDPQGTGQSNSNIFLSRNGKRNDENYDHIFDGQVVKAGLAFGENHYLLTTALSVKVMEFKRAWVDGFFWGGGKRTVKTSDDFLVMSLKQNGRQIRFVEECPSGHNMKFSSTAVEPFMRQFPMTSFHVFGACQRTRQLYEESCTKKCDYG